MRVLQVESPDAAAQRAKLHRVQTAPVIDTASPDKTKFQIVYRNDTVGKVTVQNQLSGIELHDPATGDVATMNLRIGLNYLDQRFFDSFEAEREVRKLVALGAITGNVAAELHVGVESFPPAVIEHFAYVAWHYGSDRLKIRGEAIVRSAGDRVRRRAPDCWPRWASQPRRQGPAAKSVTARKVSPSRHREDGA